MKVCCSVCGIEMKMMGGLVFSPPTYNNINKVYKYHLCAGHYNILIRQMFKLRDDKRK